MPQPKNARHFQMERLVLKASRIIGWLLASVIVVLSFVPPEMRPETHAPHNLEHFAIFFATGITFGFGYGRTPIITASILVTFSAMLELAQKLVPGRHARLSDFIVDAAALCAGVAIAAVINSRISV